MRIAIEIIFVLVILLCAWSGYKKGLVMGIGSILAIIISLYMGNLLSNTFSHEAVPVLQPFVSGYMDGTDGVIGKTLNELVGVTSTDLSVEDALNQNPEKKFKLCEESYKKMGIYSEPAKKMANEAVALAEKTDTSIPNAITDVMCDKLTYCVGFILFFVLTLIVLTVLGNLLNLSFKIPEMDKLNDIGGAVAGAVIGIMFCIVAVWALKFSGKLFPEEVMSKTIITSLFMKMDLLSHFLSL
ncbi:MAG: CvpA family protein [Oscillospiraceae bacterium]